MTHVKLGGGGSQTPWTGDVDAAGFDVTDVGVITVADGTSGAPSIAFESESTTGFYRSASGIIQTPNEVRASKVRAWDGAATVFVANGSANPKVQIGSEGKIQLGNTILNGSTDGTVTLSNAAGTLTVDLIVGTGPLLTVVGTLDASSHRAMAGSSQKAKLNTTQLTLASDLALEFSSTTLATGTADLKVQRSAAGVLQVNNGTASTGGVIEFFESASAPSAPAANGVRLYAVDSGAGKTQLYALFATGAAQLVAAEP